MWTDLSSILSQITRLTDRRTEFSSLDRVCDACSAVIIFVGSGGIESLRKTTGVGCKLGTYLYTLHLRPIAPRCKSPAYNNLIMMRLTASDCIMHGLRINCSVRGLASDRLNHLSELALTHSSSSVALK